MILAVSMAKLTTSIRHKIANAILDFSENIANIQDFVHTEILVRMVARALMDLEMEPIQILLHTIPAVVQIHITANSAS